jgi:hypothetical protein
MGQRRLSAAMNVALTVPWIIKARRTPSQGLDLSSWPRRERGLSLSQQMLDRWCVGGYEMRCDAHALALALAPGLFCSLCLVPLREVLQVKLKLLACAIAVAALVVGQHVRPRRFTSTGVAQWPNCKEQGCRDRPASRPLQAWAGTVSHIRDSDAKFGAGQGEVQSGSRQCTGREGGGSGPAAAVLRSAAENLDNQKIRGSGGIITIRMHQVLQRIIVLGFDSSRLMASKSFGPSCVR